MAMSDPFPLINLAALGQVDELECYPTITHHHQHAATASTPTAASLTSPTAAAAALHHAHAHHQHFNHRRSPSSATVSTTTTKAGALALINRGWNRLGGGATRSSSHASARYDGTSQHHYQHDLSSTVPYSADEAFQIKLGLMMKNPAIMARFQERLRADSPFNGHESIIRMEMQDFFEQELVLVDIGPEIRVAKKPTAVDGAAETAAATSASRSSSLFRSALGALVNKADDTTTTATPAAPTTSDSSSSSAVQQSQSSSPTATAWLNMSPFQNEGGIAGADSSIANTAADDATVTLVPLSSGLNSSDKSNEIQRPTYLNLPSLEIQNDTTTSSMSACSSPILENSVYEHEFSMSSSTAEEETPDAVESICASSSSSSAGSSHDDDSVGLYATTTCADTHKTHVAKTAAESQTSEVYFE